MGVKGLKKISTKALLLAILALVLMLFSDSALLFDLMASIAVIVGLRDLYQLTRHPESIRFSSILAVSILLGYGGGTLIHLISSATFYATDDQYFALVGLQYSQSGLSLALSVSMLASSGLYLRAGIERPPIKHLTNAVFIGDKPERFVWLGVAVAILAVYLKEIGFMGTAVSESGNVTAIGSLAMLIVPPLLPYTVLLMVGPRHKVKKAALGVAGIFLLAILFVLGRRILLYTLVLTLIAMQVQSYRYSRIRVATAAAYSLIGVMVLYGGFIFFMALRLALGEVGNDADLAEGIDWAFSMLGGGEASRVHAALAENVGSRPFILSYLGGLMGIDSNQTPVYGEELLYSLQMVIPSLLMPGKTSLLPPSSEALMHPLYGIPIFDGPSSILVSGFADFGFIGAIIYPIGIAWLFAFFYKTLCSLVRDPAIRIFVVFSLMFRLLSIEQSLSANFVMIRNLTGIVCILWCVGKFPIFRLTPSRVKPRPRAAHHTAPRHP